jgi:NarL family two-component system response regulator LiaR
MSRTRVLVVDAHVLVRRGIQMFLDADPSIQMVGEADNGRDAVRQAKRFHPDVVLMDLAMSQEDRIQAMSEILGFSPHIKIIVFTVFKDEPSIRAAFEAGARGYLLKNADGEALTRAIHAVQRGEMPLHPQVAEHLIRKAVRGRGMNGNKPLTERERDVLRLVAGGLSNREIARALYLTEGTVKLHVSHILGKLGVSNRTEASMLALHIGLISSAEGHVQLNGSVGARWDESSGSMASRYAA